MEKINENYLLDNLKKGRKLNVVLASHNAHWVELQIIHNHFKDFNLKVMFDRPLDIEYDGQKVEDCDIIVCFTSKYYDEKVFEKIKELGIRISNQNDKRVTIGYSTLPKENENSVHILSIKDSKIVKEDVAKLPRFTSTVLTNIVLCMHDCYIKQDSINKQNSDSNDEVKNLVLKKEEM